MTTTVKHAGLFGGTGRVRRPCPRPVRCPCRSCLMMRCSNDNPSSRLLLLLALHHWHDEQYYTTSSIDWVHKATQPVFTDDISSVLDCHIMISNRPENNTDYRNIIWMAELDSAMQHLAKTNKEQYCCKSINFAKKPNIRLSRTSDVQAFVFETNNINQYSTE